MKGKHYKVGITYRPKTGECMVGSPATVRKYAHIVAFKFFRFTSAGSFEKSGHRQRDRFRYYHQLTPSEFEEGLRRLEYRYKVLPTNSIVKFT